ncbi:MAG: hypothetical protein SGCHY_004816 [Lobulomycetales sp.]
MKKKKKKKKKKTGNQQSPFPLQSPCMPLVRPRLRQRLAWFPRMSSHHPDSCLFAASVRDNGIRLYNPFTRSLDATYISQDHVERLCAPHALSFSPDGKWIYAGYDSRLEIWNVDRPGYDKISLPTRQKYDDKGGGQSGIISCLEFNPDHSGLFACGSFSGSVGLYDQSSPSLIASLTSLGGVVQTTFSPDGTRLYTSSRKSDEIRCWDIRNTGRMLDQTLIRPGMTNQRLRFAVDPESGRFLASGDTRGNLDIFDLQDFNVEAAADRQHISPIVCEKVHNEAAADRQHISPIVCEKVHGDTIAAVDFHPVYSGIMASVSGQRRIDGIGSNAGTDCSVKVFSI